MSAPSGNARGIGSVGSGYADEYAEEFGPQDADGQRLTVHEASRVKKAVEANVQAIENRIRFFQREEEKIWRDLEEVRRQASTIEEGRGRALEKKLADKMITEAKTSSMVENRHRVAAQKKVNSRSKEAIKNNQMEAKMQAGQEQRRVSQDILRQKRGMAEQARIANMERALAIEKQKMEAKLRANQEKAMRLQQLREQQEHDRLNAEFEVQHVESRLPALEAEEMVCLQRLQNSRIVTQSVLEELESSLGSRSSVTSLLRNKQKQLEQNLEGVPEGLGGSGSIHDLSAADHEQVRGAGMSRGYPAMQR